MAEGFLVSDGNYSHWNGDTTDAFVTLDGTYHVDEILAVAQFLIDAGCKSEGPNERMLEKLRTSR